MADHAGGDETPWLTDAQLREWKSLMAILMTLPTALDTQLKRDAGINSFEYQVLAGLSEAPDRSLPLSDLAALTQGSLSRLSHAISRMEQAGWVERNPCGDPGRRTQATLTAGGWRKIVQSAPGHAREARRLVIDTLSAEQLELLGECARRVTVAADPALATRLDLKMEVPTQP